MSMTMTARENLPDPTVHATLPSGRLRQEGLVGSDRNFAVWIHLSPLLAFILIGPLAAIAPLVLWLARRENSIFNDDHGREVVNMSLTGVLVFVIGLLTGVGLLLWLIWSIVAAVNVVRGAIAAGNGEFFRYPMTFRFLKPS